LYTGEENFKLKAKNWNFCLYKPWFTWWWCHCHLHAVMILVSGGQCYSFCM